MILIFAKLNTTEKIAVNKPLGLTHVIRSYLNRKYGGEWLLVECVRNDEILKFNDNNLYKGFNTSIDRYTDIEQIDD